MVRGERGNLNKKKQFEVSTAQQPCEKGIVDTAVDDKNNHNGDNNKKL